MLQLYRDALRDAIAQHGTRGALRTLAGALADLAVTLPREWPHELSHRRHRPWRAGFRFRQLFGNPSRVALSSGATSRVIHRAMVRSMGRAEGQMQQFDLFTERARRVLTLSQEEAQRFNHNYIGTEHLLLGLVREGDGIAVQVLHNLGVELQQARTAVEFIIGRGDRVAHGEIGLTPRSNKVIELAIDESRRLGHQYVGTEHLLLGLVREGEGIAAGVLESLGVNLERVRRETIHVLGQAAPMPGAPAPQMSAATRFQQTDLGQFTLAARKVVADAFTQARTRGQQDIGAGHLLLALLDDGEGIAAQALRLVTLDAAPSLDLDAVRSELERTLGPAPVPSDQQAKGPVRLDEHALRVIALAANEAREMADLSVGPEHLLLGIVREGASIGARALLSAGVTPDALRLACAQAQTTSPRARRPAIAQITLVCRDVAATEAFYVGRFGASVVSADSDAHTVRLPGGGSLLALRATEGEAQRLGVDHIELAITVGNVALAWRTLMDDSIPNVSPISADGGSFTVLDPDGRLLRVSAGSGLVD
jgi:catechol 2,3-dioxygenase-like lactoylglutathione lyase family enzyme